MAGYPFWLVAIGKWYKDEVKKLDFNGLRGSKEDVGVKFIVVHDKTCVHTN